MFSSEQTDAARALLDAARAKGLRICTAESCTGGLIGALLTEFAGSSDVMERGFITYSNQAKEDLLDVPGELIHGPGAVSKEVAQAMAQGALKHSLAHIAVAVTGVAGPGRSENKPVGLVYIAVARLDHEPRVEEFHFGDIARDQVRMRTVSQALAMLQAAL